MALELYRRKQQELDAAELEAKTLEKSQEKFLSADVVNSDQVVSDLTFNNLEIGKTYVYELQVALLLTGLDTGVVHIKHNGDVKAVGLLADQANQHNVFTIKARFVAETTTVTVETISFGSTTLQGANNRQTTFGRLVEIPNSQVTTDFN